MHLVYPPVVTGHPLKAVARISRIRETPKTWIVEAVEIVANRGKIRFQGPKRYRKSDLRSIPYFPFSSGGWRLREGDAPEPQENRAD